MAQFPLGQVAIIPKGNYAAGTTYQPLDAVFDNGGMYLCIATATGVEPGTTSGWENYWQSMSVGIKSFSASADSNWNVEFSWELSNGQTGTSSFQVSAIPDGSVTPAKLASSVNYAAIGLTADQVRPIYVQAAVPTSASPDGIYLVTG